MILGVTEAAPSAALRSGSEALGFDGADRILPATGFGGAPMNARLGRTETVQNLGGQAALRNGRRAQRSATAQSRVLLLKGT
jgi:hypothetical protein